MNRGGCEGGSSLYVLARLSNAASARKETFKKHCCVLHRNRVRGQYKIANV
jgi:hypothetical protein